MFPLKPHDKSVTPKLKLSIIITRGLSSLGYHTVIVLSALARAITL